MQAAMPGAQLHTPTAKQGFVWLIIRCQSLKAATICSLLRFHPLSGTGTARRRTTTQSASLQAFRHPATPLNTSKPPCHRDLHIPAIRRADHAPWVQLKQLHATDHARRASIPTGLVQDQSTRTSRMSGCGAIVRPPGILGRRTGGVMTIPLHMRITGWGPLSPRRHIAAASSRRQASRRRCRRPRTLGCSMPNPPHQWSMARGATACRELAHQAPQPWPLPSVQMAPWPLP